MADTEEVPVHAYTRTRIVALLVIGVLVLGLAYLRFAPGDSSVSVPDGAQAGDLTLEPCTYGTEDGSYDADCGTLIVPENRADAGSRLIALPVTRIRARVDDSLAPIFRLEGGPGVTNMTFSKVSGGIRQDPQHRQILAARLELAENAGDFAVGVGGGAPGNGFVVRLSLSRCSRRCRVIGRGSERCSQWRRGRP